jgi:hypothetical protein
MEFQEPYNLTPDSVVEAAHAWRVAHGRGPILQGRAADAYRACSAFKGAAASSSIFVEDLVRDTIAGLFAHKYPAARFASGELITIVTQGDRGQLAFGWHELDRTGVNAASGIVSESGDNVKGIGLRGAQKIQPVHTVARSFDYTMIDLDASAMQGAFDLVAEKARAVREQLDEDFDSYIADGVPGAGWPSLYAYPGGMSVAATVGTWATADSAEIVADVGAAIDAQLNLTTGVEQSDTVLFARQQWTLLRQPYGPEGTRSRLDLLRSTYPEIARWDWERHLPSGKAFFYRNDPTKVAVRAPVRFEFLPPEVTAMAFRVIVRNRFGGCYSPAPRSMVMLTGL